MRPVVAAILQHPDLYHGQRMVKPPVVHVAGLLRRIGAGHHDDLWSWIGQISGQQLFYPPNVAGWDDTRWLDTATFRGRWASVSRCSGTAALNPSKPRRHTEHRTGSVDSALNVLEQPPAVARDARPARTGSRAARCATGRPTGSRRPTRCSSRTRFAS